MFKLYYAGTQEACEYKLVENGNLRLVSYADSKKTINQWIERETPVFMDSGAYSAFTRNAYIDIDFYIDYVNFLDEYLICFAQLDVIPGEPGKPKTQAQLLKSAEDTWQNYLYMRERVKNVDKCLPVFHRGSDFMFLNRLLAFEPKIDYMALGALVGASSVERDIWLTKVFKVIAASPNPNVKVHAFGMTSLKLLERFPFYSADSTSWIMTGSNGLIMTQFGNLLVSGKATKDSRHINNLSKEHFQAVKTYVEEKGFTLEGLAEKYIDRILLNVAYLTDWSRSYQYKPKQVAQNRLF